MDFMAPRALSPSFNKVKSKALSICQWARGTVDAAVFNPRDATVHCMLDCSLIAGLLAQLSPGDFLVPLARQIYCYIDEDKAYVPWTSRSDRNVEGWSERQTKTTGEDSHGS